MNLLVFAHRGEAQTFIKELNAKSIETNLYQSSDELIYICGEGIYDVLTNLALIINDYKPLNILNYGIAGSLSTTLNINEIYSISSVYLEDNNELEFKSFPLKGDIECISAHNRVLDNEYAQRLRPIAKIIDRELWAIAKVAAFFKINCSSYKIISDFAGENTDCFDLKDKAKFFSEKLFNHYQANENKIKNTNIVEKIEIPFEMSQYQKNVISKLIKEIDEKDLEIIIKTFREKNKLTKKDTNDFINEIKKQIYPVKYQIINQIEQEIQNLKVSGMKVYFDENLEKEKLNLNIEINSQKNVTDCIKAFENFNYDEFLKIFKGDLNV